VAGGICTSLEQEGPGWAMETIRGSNDRMVDARRVAIRAAGLALIQPSDTLCRQIAIARAHDLRQRSLILGENCFDDFRGR